MAHGLTTVLLIIVLALLGLLFKNSKNNRNKFATNTNKGSRRQSITTRQTTPQNEIPPPPPINNTFQPTKQVIDTPLALKELSLITTEDICETQQQATLSMLRHYRKPHPMLISLAKGNVSQRELSAIVKSDAKIAGRILFIVNSPRFGVQQPIKDINHAIMYLGLSEVRAIATELALKSSFDTNVDHDQSFSNIWKASALASGIALELGKIIGKDNASELSTLCLLSYLGDLILLSSNPDASFLYENGMPFYERTTKTQLKYKTNSAMIGSKAASSWELPKVIVKGIEHSLSPLTNFQNVRTISEEEKVDIIICYLANRIAELAVFEQKSKVEKMNILNQIDNLHLEFFHIDNMLNDYNLNKIKNLLKANDFVHKANALISKHINN